MLLLLCFVVAGEVYMWGAGKNGTAFAALQCPTPGMPFPTLNQPLVFSFYLLRISYP